LEEEDINSALQGENATINKLNNSIANLKERKGRIDYTEVIKKPTPSISPISPKKKINILIAALIGVMLFLLIAFLFEYLQEHIVR
jgi:capsular polysaccharide biosynthesis protein